MVQTKKQKSPVKKTTAKSRKKQKNIYRDFIPVISVFFFSFLLMALVTTYGFFTYYRTGQETNKVTTANFNIVLDDNGDPGINDPRAFPVYDEVGRKTDPYSFSLKNLGTVPANYVLKLVPDENAILEDNCADNLLADKSIKMQLIKNGVVTKELLLSELTDYVIDTGYIGLEDGINKTHTYELRLWIASEAGAEVMGRHYHGRVDVILSDPANA